MKNRNKYFREWRKKNQEEYRKYKREWARKDREKKNALKPRCKTCGQIIKVIHSHTLHKTKKRV